MKKLTVCAFLFAMISLFAYTNAFAGGKTVICHQNTDNPDEQATVTIEVSDHALPAHLAHGDVVGSCPVE